MVRQKSQNLLIFFGKQSNYLLSGFRFNIYEDYILAERKYAPKQGGASNQSFTNV